MAAAATGGGPAVADGRPPLPSKKKPARDMDFDAYPKRHVVLRVAYHGQDMDGLARQESTTNTVEHHVLQALVHVRLIPPLTLQDGTTLAPGAPTGKALLVSPEKFSRCGRTDKGVSALGNAFSLVVRGAKEGQADLQYAHMLNRALPPTIRVVAWSFVADNFDARFSCVSRTYRYFFSTVGRDLRRMQEAADLLLGEHDFRNFCKMDVVNVSNFVRTVYSATIFDAATEQPVAAQAGAATVPPAAAYVEIRGNAFLYHQIRCIMTVLFLVAEGKEAVTIVPQLLDVAQRPGKPCYPLADERNLVLWDCDFRPDEVAWRVDDGAFASVLLELAERSAAMHVAAAISDNMARSLRRKFDRTDMDAEAVAPGRGGAGSRYVPLLQRPTEHTFEQKVAGLSAAKQHRREANQSHTTSGRDRVKGATVAPEQDDGE